MKFFQNIFLLILATCSLSSAFAPIASPAQQRNLMGAGEKSSTAIGPGFLKDLGFEKPSWLPDFGGGDKKEEEAHKAEASDEEADGGEDSEAAAETEEAPAP